MSNQETCKYCHPRSDWDGKTYSLLPKIPYTHTLIIKHEPEPYGPVILNGGFGYGHEVKTYILFCPMCGRKLHDNTCKNLNAGIKVKKNTFGFKCSKCNHEAKMDKGVCPNCKAIVED